MNHGEMLISKVIDTGDVEVFKKLGVYASHFATEEEQKAYRFINEYYERNQNVPDYRTVVAEIDHFTYIPNVGDSFEYLVKELKDYSAKNEVANFLRNDVNDSFNRMGGMEWIKHAKAVLEKIENHASTRAKVGTEIVESDVFLEEFYKRKEGKSIKIWRSHFPTINKIIGGYQGGNMYTWYARSGRGKSVFTTLEVIQAALDGATVLIWSLEMDRYQVFSRIYSFISANLGMFTAKINGSEYKAGFESKALAQGRLNEYEEEGLLTFLENLNELIKGKIIVRAVDDKDFDDRSLDALEQDILALKPDVVLIDPFYYLDMEANTAKVAGGDAANTSKKLRRIAGKHSIVVHTITQSEELKNEKDEDGRRELKIPSRAEIKKTKAVLEDCATSFGIDSNATEGQALVEIQKIRNSAGEGTNIEVLYLPSYGIVRELTDDEAMEKQFEDEW